MREIAALKDSENPELTLRTSRHAPRTMGAMLQALDHVTVCSANLPRTLAFYQRLGLRQGPRPPFGMAGLWLYAGEQALVHVMEGRPAGDGGAFDHVAFQARGRAVLSAALQAAGIAFELKALPDGSALQLFVRDPDGARIELVFRQLEDR
jgi:catechol 2,3-dioxygenase-like lactoylglutathione lyase family enzyme